MNIIHFSAECYPAAKVGGLADVVGTLPKYLQQKGVDACVVMPKYSTAWLQKQSYKTVFNGQFNMNGADVSFQIQRQTDTDLGFPLFVVDIPRFFDRPNIYLDPSTGEGYRDEGERFMAYQRAALQWVMALDDAPDLLHCHDHHSALIPFMVSCCEQFRSLHDVPTVVTVHNAEYQGRYDSDFRFLLPSFAYHEGYLLDWNYRFNSLAAGLRCAHQITTVSPTYMQELQHHSSGLEMLFRGFDYKSQGIINGIDTELWNPADDPYLEHHYSKASATKGKKKNKQALTDQFNLDPDRPLISFIGRLASEKGADLLPDLFKRIIHGNTEANFLVLGTGAQELHHRFSEMQGQYVGFFDASLEYNEQLAHRIYAGSDFMIMPSRVEPCGLNQMYAMRYGTIPIVRSVGGLHDTVIDAGDEDGYGFTFVDFSIDAAADAIHRACHAYRQPARFKKLQQKIMRLDFSWKSSADAYLKMYHQLT